MCIICSSNRLRHRRSCFPDKHTFLISACQCDKDNRKICELCLIDLQNVNRHNSKKICASCTTTVGKLLCISDSLQLELVSKLDLRFLAELEKFNRNISEPSELERSESEKEQNQEQKQKKKREKKQKQKQKQKQEQKQEREPNREQKQKSIQINKVSELFEAGTVLFNQKYKTFKMTETVRIQLICQFGAKIIRERREKQFDPF